jgi:3-oxoacyl-[acyl-carrier protein] reductase
MPDLAGQVAIVTGGGRGLGREVALALARAGAAVGIWARSADEVERVADEVAGTGGRADPASVDVTDQAAVEAAARRVEEELGPPALLVNNAGTLRAVGLPWEVEVEDWKADVDTSLLGSYLCARAVLPGMVERGSGRIVNVASNVAVRPAPHQSGYAAGKAGVLSLTEALAAAVAGRGPAVFAVSPGYVETALTRGMHEAAAGEPWADGLASGKTVDPERLTDLVLLLASGRADGLTGRYLHALDDVDELLRRAEEVRRDDLHVPRLGRLSR